MCPASAKRWPDVGLMLGHHLDFSGWLVIAVGLPSQEAVLYGDDVGMSTHHYKCNCMYQIIPNKFNFVRLGFRMIASTTSQSDCFQPGYFIVCVLLCRWSANYVSSNLFAKWPCTRTKCSWRFDCNFVINIISLHAATCHGVTSRHQCWSAKPKDGNYMLLSKQFWFAVGCAYWIVRFCFAEGNFASASTI